MSYLQKTEKIDIFFKIAAIARSPEKFFLFMLKRILEYTSLIVKTIGVIMNLNARPTGLREVM